MSSKNELPSEYDTLLWRKRLSEERCRQIRYYAERDHTIDHPLMQKMIEEADREAANAARLYDEYIKENPAPL